MPLVPLQIPAGFYRNGTDLEGSGRWRDGSLVRWREGSLRPVGGWRERIVDMFAVAPRGMHVWESNAGERWTAGGTFNKLIIATSGGLTYDITPVGLTAGTLDAEVNTGYSGGFYGVGPTRETLARQQRGRWTTGANSLSGAATRTASCMNGSLTLPTPLRRFLVPQKIVLALL